MGSPCRYSSGNTSVICGDLRAQPCCGQPAGLKPAAYVHNEPPGSSAASSPLVLDQPGTSASAQLPMTEFMMVPALVTVAPPIIAPATIFGDSRLPPFHFSQANRPPP
ncbi:hypothetical protein ABH933_004729 [Nocardia sp. GP40]